MLLSNFVKMFNNHVVIKSKASFKINIKTKSHQDSVGLAVLTFLNEPL